MKFEKISADEAHNHRKGITNDMGVMAKGIPVSPEVVRAPSFDKEARTARFVMSAEITDRMGDVVCQEGLSLESFNANPQALLFHNSRSWPIGKWIDVEKVLNGRPKRTEGTMKLLPKGDDVDADRAGRHMAAGTMRTVSIGFRPDWDQVEAIRNDDGAFTGLRFLASDLLEASLVPIPALPAAAMKELSTGMLSAESLELIKGILEQFELKDGSVLNREQLETAVREAGGNKTFYGFDLGLMPVGSTLKKNADGTVVLADHAGVVLAGGAQDDLIRHPDGTPVLRDTGPLQAPAPKDGEETPVAPNPADTEKTKADDLAIVPLSVITSEKLADDMMAILKEEAERPETMFTRLLKLALPLKTKAPDPVVELPAPADADRLKAAISRAQELEAAAPAALEPHPA